MVWGLGWVWLRPTDSGHVLQRLLKMPKEPFPLGRTNDTPPLQLPGATHPYGGRERDVGIGVGAIDPRSRTNSEMIGHRLSPVDSSTGAAVREGKVQRRGHWVLGGAVQF